jgi:ketosteroid isomerase-like protein
MKHILTLLLIIFMQPSFAQNDTEQKIRTILAEQTASWNNGDLVAFMKGYWKNDSLLFVGKNGPTYGYQKTLSNYQKSYPDKTAMGNLAFNILQVQPLSADTWLVLGKWSLTRSIGNLSGHYTLLFKKIDKEWVIIADHSS